MLIQDALKPTGKAVLSGSDDFAQEHDDELMWCRIAGDAIGILACVGWKDVAMNDWQPYHEEKEIKPEKAGELWEHKSHGKCFIVEDGSSLAAQTIRGCQRFTIGSDHSWDDFKDIRHNKTGWTRLYPSVEDESVDRIEIEGVSWRYSHGIYFPVADTDIEFSELKEKGRMKMILVIPKDKP